MADEMKSEPATTLPSTEQTDNATKDREIERQKQRTERFKSVLGLLQVAITVGIGTLGLGWMNHAYQEREKAAADKIEQTKLGLENIRLQVAKEKSASDQRLQEMKYLGDFLKIALSNEIEQRVRMAEFFSFLTLTPEFKSAWNNYYAELKSAIRDTEELEDQRLQAQKANDQDQVAKLDQQIRYHTLNTVSLKPTIALATASPVGAASRLTGAAETPAATRPPIKLAGDCPDELKSFVEPLTSPHQRYSGSVQWRLTATGVDLLDVADPALNITPSPAESALAVAIMTKFEQPLREVAKQTQVPIELLVATVATQSAGNPNALRREPGYQDDESTPQRVSLGLTQMLLSSARAALGEPGLTSSALADPKKSIQAGAAFIKLQSRQTNYDPPLVASAYSAGRVAFQDAVTNSWKLLAFPIGSPIEVNRFVRYLNGTMTNFPPKWLTDEALPNFRRCFAKAG